MKSNVLVGLICVVLLAACETTSDEAASAAGSGTEGSAISSGSVSSLPSNPVEQAPLDPANAPSELVSVGDRVYFNFDQYTLTPQARSIVEAQAVLLKRYPSTSVTIEGHADERGTREYNLALGDRRANAVKDYLIALGVSPSRIQAVTYGEERPSVVGSNESIWAQNRRAVTVVTGASPSS